MPSETLDNTPNPLLQMLSEEERKAYTVQSPYPQSYSYPLAIISYIARHPANLNDHENLIKSAKSLFRLSRIIPVKEVENWGFENKWMANNQRFSLTDRSFDIWITSELNVGSSKRYPYFASTLLKRVYRCNLEFLGIYRQILTFAELKLFLLGDELQSVEFIENIVKNDVHGSVVEFKKVFEALLKAWGFRIELPSEQHGIGIVTSKKMIELLEKQKISHSVTMENIPETFHFAIFACFLKTNLTGSQRIKHRINLSFSDAVSDEFKNQLQTFVYEIIALVEQDPSLRGIYVPKIEFAGHDEAAYLKLLKMQVKPGPQYAIKTVRITP